MRHPRRFRLLLACALVMCVAAVAAALAFATGSGSAGEIEAYPGPEAFLTSHGVSASEAQEAFTLENGETVSTIENGQSRCLVHGVGTQVTGRCFSAAEVSEGKAVSVFDECGTSGSNLMEITGLAPAAVAKVRLLNSDSSTEDATPIEGAFKFEGTNPGESDPYPTSVKWINAEGASVGSANLPVSAGEFCLPTE